MLIRNRITEDFDLSCVVGVSAFTVVEANTLKEAIEIAKSRPVVIWSRGESNREAWVITDADGEPTDIHAG